VYWSAGPEGAGAAAWVIGTQACEESSGANIPGSILALAGGYGPAAAGPVRVPAGGWNSLEASKKERTWLKAHDAETDLFVSGGKLSVTCSPHAARAPVKTQTTTFQAIATNAKPHCRRIQVWVNPNPRQISGTFVYHWEEMCDDRDVWVRAASAGTPKMFMYWTASKAEGGTADQSAWAISSKICADGSGEFVPKSVVAMAPRSLARRPDSVPQGGWAARGDEVGGGMQVTCVDANDAMPVKPAPCELGTWGSWGPLNAQGIKKRSRPVPRCMCDAFDCCPGPPGSKPVDDMGGSSADDKDCYDVAYSKPEAPACNLGQWGSWGACNEHGMQNRTRPVPRCLCETFGCCPGPPGSDPVPWMGDDPSNDLVSAACRLPNAWPIARLVCLC